MNNRQAPTLGSLFEDDAKFGWLDKVADPLQQGVKTVFERMPLGSKVKSMLNGTPIQHRMHPAVVAVPIGSWAASLLFDVLSRGANAADARSYQKAADVTIALGIVSAIPAAKTGLADWVDLYDHRRRVGMAHALLNVVALTCYSTSLALRSGDGNNRGLAQALSGTGFGLLALSGALGGELVYTLGVNVPHTVYPKPPNEFTDVLSSDELVDGKPVLVEVQRVPVLVVRRDDEIFAVDAWCPHAGGPLAEGTFDGDVVECPWHQSRFCLRDGRALQGPAASPLRTFAVREAGGRISLKPSYEGQSWPPPPDPPADGPQHIDA